MQKAVYNAIVNSPQSSVCVQSYGCGNARLFGQIHSKSMLEVPDTNISSRFMKRSCLVSTSAILLSLSQAIPDVRVVGFATPACADVGVSRLCEGLCTSVVLHDDVVPRVTPHAVRALLKDLLCTKVITVRWYGPVRVREKSGTRRSETLPAFSRASVHSV